MKTAYLFPGQGSQFVGMGRVLCEQHAVAHELFAAADAQLGYALSTLCFEGPEDTLTATEHQQAANYVLGVARWHVMQEQADWPPPAFIVGQSMGAITALAASGAVSFADGLRLAQQRGVLMQANGLERPGAMAAVLGLSAEKTAAICAHVSAETGQILQLANDNSLVHQNISGETAAVDTALHRLLDAGARKVVRLPISIASHCALMQPVAAQFAELVTEIDVRDAAVPLISNVTAMPIQTADALRREIVEHLTVTVRWRESMLALCDASVTQFIDVGPGNSLSKLMKRIDRTVTRRAFEDA